MATTLTSSYQLICSKSTSTYSTLRLYGKLNSQNTTNNTSSITLQARLYGNGGSGSFSSGSIKITATSGSSTTNLGSTSYSKNSEKTLKTWTTTVSHSTDGSYANKSVSAVLTSTANPNGTASGTITVKTIPRENSITVPDQADIGSNVNIVIGNNSSSFKNTVTWSCNGLSGTVVATNGTTLDKVPSGTYAWQVPTSIFATIPSGKSATVSFVNKTYSGTTQIGDDTTDSLTANVPTSSNPTLTLVSKVETTQAVKDAIPSSATDFTKPIINLSKPKFTFTATANDSATLVSLTVTNGNNTRTVTLSGTTQTVEYTFQNPMTDPIITFDVTDSRGSTMTTPYVFNGTSQQFVYTVPIFKTVELERPDIRQNVVNAEIEGTYTIKKLDGTTNNKIWVGFDSMEVGGQYSGTIEWFESGVSQYITLDTTNGTWSFNGNLSSKTAEYNKSYYFTVYVKDDVTGTQQEFVYMLKKSVPTMSLGESDMQVNGELYLGDEDGDNVVEMFGLTGTPRYDSTQSYTVGSYCVYNNSLYKCIANTTGTFDANSWSTTNIMTEIGQGGGSGGTSNYNDLTNKPSVNGVSLVGNKTTSDLGITIPTKVSDLTNDAGYINSSALPTKTSDLTNDSGFIEAKTFDLEDIEVITSTSDTTYTGIKNCIDNNLPFKIKYLDLSSTNTYEVIYAYKYSNTYEFSYETDFSIETIKLSNSGTSVTVTQTYKLLQEQINSTNKLDYSLIDNTPTIPTIDIASTEWVDSLF